MRTSQPLRLVAAEGIQWFTFALASFVSAPVIVATAFRLDHHGATALIQSAFVFGGIGALWQLFFGHKMLLNVVPGLLWATVALGLARFGDAGTGPMTGLLTDMQGALIVIGIVLILLTWTGVVRRLVPLLTPLTMSAFMLLLVVQAAPAIMRDALAIGVHGPGPDPAATIASLSLVLLFLVLSHPRRPTLFRALALPFAIVGGGIVLVLAGLVWPGSAPATAVTDAIAAVQPDPTRVGMPIFPWGPPTFRLSLIVALLPNVLPVLAGISSAIVGVAEVYGDDEIDARGVQRSVFGIGLLTTVAAANTTIGPVLQSEGAGFLAMTGMRRRRGFALGMVLIALVGLSPALVGVLAAVPKSLFAAALAAAFSAMSGVAIRTLLRGPTTQRELTIFGIAMLFGCGVAFLPAEALLALPLGLRDLVSNGMIVGVLVAMLLEHVVFPRPWENGAA